MASENGDPFDGASPNVFHLQEADSYDDLLGVQVHIEDLDLPMPESQEELVQSTPGLDNEAMSDIFMENSKIEPLVQSKDTDADILPGLTPQPCKVFASEPRDVVTVKPGVKEKDTAEPEKSKRSSVLVKCEKGTPNPMLAQHVSAKKIPPNELSSPNGFICNRVLELSDTGDETLIKKEDNEDPLTWTSMPDDIISISDSDEDHDTLMLHSDGSSVPIKNEDNEDPLTWTSIPDDIISISDSDEDHDTLMLHSDGSSVPIKKEDDEVEFLWANMGDRVIELDSDSEPSATSKLNLGKSFLKGINPKGRRPPIDLLGARRAQEAYLRAHRRNHDIPEPSAYQGVLNGLGLQGLKRSDLSVDDNGSAWMNTEYISDEDTGRNFRALRKSYNSKVRKNINTLDDDIEFVKAEKAENLRLARLKAEYEDARGYSDDDNSDDGLFVSPSSARTSRPKRRAADEPNAENEISDSRTPKHRKPNNSRKGTQHELDQEQEFNMMAGIEGVIRKIEEEKAEKSGKKGKHKSGRNAKAGKKEGSKRMKRTPNDRGYLNDSNSLLTSNVYEDADANLNREALPVSGHTHKKKALAALVASVPLGTTKKDAVAEKNHILKSTVTLGRNIKGTCKADGANGWKLTGMKSSLRHHQVQGAAFMKNRETGGEKPLGGILVSLLPLDYLKKDTLTLRLRRRTPWGWVRLLLRLPV